MIFKNYLLFVALSFFAFSTTKHTNVNAQNKEKSVSKQNKNNKVNKQTTEEVKDDTDQEENTTDEDFNSYSQKIQETFFPILNLGKEGETLYLTERGFENEKGEIIDVKTKFVASFQNSLDECNGFIDKLNKDYEANILTAKDKKKYMDYYYNSLLLSYMNVSMNDIKYKQLSTVFKNHNYKLRIKIKKGPLVETWKQLELDTAKAYKELYKHIADMLKNDITKKSKSKEIQAIKGANIMIIKIKKENSKYIREINKKMKSLDFNKISDVCEFVNYCQNLKNQNNENVVTVVKVNNDSESIDSINTIKVYKDEELFDYDRNINNICMFLQSDQIADLLKVNIASIKQGKMINFITKQDDNFISYVVIISNINKVSDHEAYQLASFETMKGIIEKADMNKIINDLCENLILSENLQNYFKQSLAKIQEENNESK